ncbi:MAG: sodium:solute symporter family protein [Melioribacteraceae bacterium]|nr:sodium:solute symporter family protein [Melioribacteraceae bacterium]
MISFNLLDYSIVIAFLLVVVIIGLIAARGNKKSEDDYLLSGRKVGLVLFVLTNVATWYGGILGVGEFSFRYGLVSWFTQGLPYYIFAFIFAFFFASKIKSAELFTIPDKLEEVYGKKTALISSVLIFILVSPAPYLLILGQIVSMVFDLSYVWSLIISSFVSSVYLIKGGYKSNIWADAFSFFIMFLGFIIIVLVAINNYGDFQYLSQNLPEEHLTLTGGTSITFVTVWFLIALWTFTDPGFHQRCYSAISGKVAKWGIVISVFFWILFDFLTNTTGLYSKAILPNLEKPVLAFPSLANEILSPGLKGLFFAALIATVLSTLNSFIFLSATTFSRDFIFRLTKTKKLSLSADSNESPKIFLSNLLNKLELYFTQYNLITQTKLGIIFTLIISLIIAYFFESVVELWYTIGSICIPGLILLVVSSYYQKLRISNNLALFEILIGVSSSIVWLFLRQYFSHNEFLSQLEPMIIGLVLAVITHLYGLKIKYNN